MAPTFEDNGIFWDPDVAKSPHFPRSFKKHPACKARIIDEDADRLMSNSLESPDRFLSEFTPVCLGRYRERFVEVGVLLENQSLFFVPKTAELPKNF